MRILALIFTSVYCIVFCNQAKPQTNPYYWKNRIPVPGYWQQDVYYKIKATLDDKTDIITATQELTYKNNSPDTLTFVFFHLYQNAFQPGSYFDDLTKNNDIKPRYGKYESQKKNIEILSLKATSVNGNISNSNLKLIYDNTILKVELPESLLPGQEVVFSIRFKTYYDNGSQRRRMQMYNAWGYKHYNGCQWYPKICVYDKKFGWDTQQHLNHEFYGDFGTFDVELTFPNNYINEATGVLQNENEVLPSDLRQKLDIRNFATKKWNEPPSVIIPPDGTTKTWHYIAENVHDFAFTCDPTYRLSETVWNGIKCIAIAQEPHCSGWQNASEYAAKIIEVFSNDIGLYGYPKMIVADARDGMEYPMLTMDGGRDPGYRGLFVHEIGHNWFYGMVGNNETYRAMLDEGFTQFLTAWGLVRIEGEYIRKNENARGYAAKFFNPVSQRFNSAYLGYLNAALNDEDGTLNTHSDQFNGALGHGGGYGQVYRKTATMLYNLQYVLGDELFLKAMQHYFNQWKFCHPYIEDFRNSIIEYTHVDLNWFFDQWIESDKKIDYKICNVRKTSDENMYLVKFKRIGRMTMPLDFTVYSNCGAKYDYYIPNTWFNKKTSAETLPKWEGWDNVFKTYCAKINIPCGIGNVVIDTTFRIADVNMLNNSLTFPARIKFDNGLYSYPNWQHYILKVRPDIWYNSYDGIKTGFHLDGNYFNRSHFFTASFWINTALLQRGRNDYIEINKNDQASFVLGYKTPLAWVNKNFNAWVNGKQLDGLTGGNAGVEQFSKNEKTRLFFEMKMMYRQNTTDLDYLLYLTEWHSARYNNTVNAGITQSYQKPNYNGSATLQLTSSSLYSDFSYSKIIFTNVNQMVIGKLVWHNRLFAQYGTGNNLAPESALHLAGANNEELMENKFLRSYGFVPEEWLNYGAQTNHFQQGGGLNLRGYAGYVIPVNKPDGIQYYFYQGTTGASISSELDLDGLIKFRPNFTKDWLHLDLYLFADAGIINTAIEKNEFEFTDIKADAGIGMALTIKKFGPLQTPAPLTVRFDMPFVLNQPPALENDFVKFRYVVGINRSF